jgi:hypothetical protein
MSSPRTPKTWAGHTRVLTVEQVLKTKVWGSTVAEWITESYWSELCRQDGYDKEQEHVATITVEDGRVLIRITIV